MNVVTEIRKQKIRVNRHTQCPVSIIKTSSKNVPKLLLTVICTKPCVYFSTPAHYRRLVLFSSILEKQVVTSFSRMLEKMLYWMRRLNLPDRGSQMFIWWFLNHLVNATACDCSTEYMAWNMRCILFEQWYNVSREWKTLYPKIISLDRAFSWYR